MNYYPESQINGQNLITIDNISDILNLEKFVMLNYSQSIDKNKFLQFMNDVTQRYHINISKNNYIYFDIKNFRITSGIQNNSRDYRSYIDSNNYTHFNPNPIVDNSTNKLLLLIK